MPFKQSAAPALCAGLLSLCLISVAHADGHASLKDDFAEPPRRTFYVHAFGGLALAPDANFDGIIGGNPQSVDVEFDTGGNFGVAVGATLGDAGALRPRAELELSYRSNDVDRIFFSGNGPAEEINVAGDVSALNVMANLLFDLPTGTALTPYAGVGVGVSFVDLDFVYGPGVRVPQSTSAFAAQLIGGASLAISESTAITFDARYLRAFNVDSQRLNPAGVSTGVVEDDIDTVALNVGLKFSF
ncbi:MAG: outer membrane beta-barrel protein [Pseudomonadota bacterium]